MKRIYILLFMLGLYSWTSAQITNGEVNYEMRIDQWYQGCDNDSFNNDDNEVRVGLTSDANTGGTATWTSGGNGATCTGNNYVRRWQADAASTVTNANTLLYFCTGRTNVSNLFTVNHSSWEEDGSPDCDASGDACQSSGTWAITFKSAAKTPNRWWGYNGTADGPSYMTGQSGDFSGKTVWRYTNGTACGSALNFGTLISGTSYTHTNSNRAAPAGASASMGYTNVSGNTSQDVFYQFTLSAASTISLSTVGSNYDTYIRLYNSTACGTQIAADDDGGGSTTSLISMSLCAGTYVVQVEGFSSNAGDFLLTVLANTISSSGGTIAGGTSPSCAGSDPGAFTSSSDGAGVATLAYQWESSTTSNSTGFGNITGETNTTYDPSTISQTTWYRRRMTDACGTVLYSNVIQISVTPSVAASVSIAASPGTNICLGTNVTFTATPINGGTPSYQWKLNGGNVGTGSTTYSNNELTSSSIVTCVMTSTATCVTGSPATSNAMINLVPVLPAAIAGSATAVCAVSAGSSFVHFLDATGKLVVSINPGSNNLGTVTSEVFDQGPSVITQACNTSTNPAWKTAALGRSWKITPQFNLSATVQFPFEDGEMNDLVAASAGTASNPRDDVSSRTDLKMSRFHDNVPGNGNQEDGSWLNNCTDGGTVIEMSQAGNGATPLSIASSQYVQFSTAGFSEFWLHGDLNSSPLPVSLTVLSAACNLQNEVLTSWSTESEQNSQKFTVEKSRDLNQWKHVSEVGAAGNSSLRINYAATDTDPYNGISYYRLIQVDNDGSRKMYGPISVSCADKKNGIIVFPNPAKGGFTVEISSAETISNAVIQLADLTGKVISERSFNLLEGQNHIFFDGEGMQLGTYIVRLNTGNKKYIPARVVIVD